MTYISSRRVKRVSIPYSSTISIGLWAVLPNQYEDAEELLRNRRHKPKVVLSRDAMEALEATAKAEMARSFDRAVERVLAMVIGGAILLALAYVGYSIWHDT